MLLVLFFLQYVRLKLASILFCYRSESYVIKWVDDTHALVIFSSSELAERAIATSLQIFKIRPLSEATLQSVSTAQRFAGEYLHCSYRGVLVAQQVSLNEVKLWR
jgi:hypothetical protein